MALTGDQEATFTTSLGGGGQENVTRIFPVDMNREIKRIMDKMDKKTKVKAGKIGSEVLKNMFGSIVEDTPVNDLDPGDMGQTKANWQLSTGSPANGVLESRQPNRTRKNIQIPKSFKQVFNNKWYFVNNVPWINSLEWGGYPNPPKKGSWNPRSGQYEIRTSGGFSLQAPQGMYRKNIRRYKQFLNDAVSKFANK